MPATWPLGGTARSRPVEPKRVRTATARASRARVAGVDCRRRQAATASGLAAAGGSRTATRSCRRSQWSTIACLERRAAQAVPKTGGTSGGASAGAGGSGSGSAHVAARRPAWLGRRYRERLGHEVGDRHDADLVDQLERLQAPRRPGGAPSPLRCSGRSVAMPSRPPRRRATPCAERPSRSLGVLAGNALRYSEVHDSHEQGARFLVVEQVGRRSVRSIRPW